MDFHRRLLRGMLWLLALAAAAGIASIFFSTHVMGRVAGTAFVCAVGMALALPVSRLLDDERSRAGGLTSLASIVVGFVLASAAIWVEFLAGWRRQERLALTSFIVTITGMLAGFLLPRLSASHPPARGPSVLLSELLAAALVLLEIWMPYGQGFDAKFGQTGGLVVGSGFLAALALIGLGVDTPERRWSWRWVGVGGAAVGLSLGFLGVWYVHTHDPTLYILSMSAALTIGYANVLLRIPLGPSSPLIRVGAIGSLAATAALVLAMSLITHGFDTQPDPLLIKVAGAGGVTTACAAMAVLILYRLNRRVSTAKENVTDITAVALTCPHCDRKHSATMGDSACPGCGLVFSLKVREPRLAQCDYPLLGIQGSVCPECGTSRLTPSTVTP